MIHQAGHFGINLLCQAILSNHFHLVRRSRSDVVAEWDDSEVVRRWLMLCPEHRDAKGNPEEPSEFELNHIHKAKLKVIRGRLSDTSCWMRLLSQSIAQRTNKEKASSAVAVRLLDETAVLACVASVDLNPMRAALADTIEDNDFTSAQKRCCDVRVKYSVGSIQYSVNEDSCSNAAVAQVSKCRVVPQGDKPTQESRVGDTGYNGGRHLAPVQLHGGS